MIFIVYGAVVGCESVAIEDATISVEITGPDGAEGPVVTLPDTSWPDGALFWEKWKPTAGATYSATVTLTCGADEVTKEYEFTVPDPASSGCNCCTERTIDYITISGMTGAAASVNGTYAITTGGIAYSWPFTSVTGNNYCSRQPVTQPAATAAPPVGSRCVSGPDTLHTCTNGLGQTVYYYANGGSVYAFLPTNNTGAFTTVRVQITYEHRYYRQGTSCFEAGLSCAVHFQRWEYEIACNTGEATLLRYFDSDSNTSPPTGPLISANPTVQVFFEP